MDALWQWQVRIGFSEDFAMMVQREPSNLVLTSLNDVLAKSKATLMRQFDAFADYMTEAEEEEGIQHYPLYKWTKATIEDPAKKAKHLQCYAVYVSGEEVYPKEVADAVARQRRPRVYDEAFCQRHRSEYGSPTCGDSR